MYYIIEHQHRTDGVINCSETGRTTLASALSHYHERYSKMVMNTEFPTVDLMLVKDNLEIIEVDHITTQYTPDVEEEVTEEVAEE